MQFTIKLKDSTPSVGIFEIIDDAIGTLSESIDNLPNTNNYVDGGIMFHRDLVWYMYKSKNSGIKEETMNFIKKNYNNPNLHRVFPRGRLCYNITTRQFDLYGPIEVLRDERLVNRILRNFDIGGRKVNPIVDPHYEILPKEEL